jgi:hypothetical protein
MQPSESQQPIPYRSIAEMRIANELLSREGQWDDSRKGFRTKECQLQERSRHFHQLHQVLRYTPAEAYARQGNDTGYLYPLCLREMIKRKPTGSDGIEDPSGPQIEQRKVIAAQNKMRQEKNVSKQLREVEGVLRKAASETLSMDRRDSVQLSGMVTPSRMMMSGLGGGDLSGVQDSPIASRSPQSRLIGASPSPAGQNNSSSASTTGRRQQYSSVLVQMKRTKQDAERAAKEFTAVRTILEMPATPQLKGTITKMFAHPDAAEELSQQEHDRREREFEEERLANLRYQNTMLQEERLVIEKEMQQMRGAGRR